MAAMSVPLTLIVWYLLSPPSSPDLEGPPPPEPPGPPLPGGPPICDASDMATPFDSGRYWN